MVLGKVCSSSSVMLFFVDKSSRQSPRTSIWKYNGLHSWNKWNTLYDKTGFPKKICVAKIFWEKEQPLKSPRHRKAVRIKGRVATQWATLFVAINFVLCRTQNCVRQLYFVMAPLPKNLLRIFSGTLIAFCFPFASKVAPAYGGRNCL